MFACESRVVCVCVHLCVSVLPSRPPVLMNSHCWTALGGAETSDNTAWQQSRRYTPSVRVRLAFLRAWCCCFRLCTCSCDCAGLLTLTAVLLRGRCRCEDKALCCAQRVVLRCTRSHAMPRHLSRHIGCMDRDQAADRDTTVITSEMIRTQRASYFSRPGYFSPITKMQWVPRRSAWIGATSFCYGVPFLWGAWPSYLVQVALSLMFAANDRTLPKPNQCT